MISASVWLSRDCIAHLEKREKTAVLIETAGYSLILTRLLKCPGPQLNSSWPPLISNLQTSFSTTTLFILIRARLKVGWNSSALTNYRSDLCTLRRAVNTCSTLKSSRALLQENKKKFCWNQRITNWQVSQPCPHASMSIHVETQCVENRGCEEKRRRWLQETNWTKWRAGWVPQQLQRELKLCSCACTSSAVKRWYHSINITTSIFIPQLRKYNCE